MRIINIFLIFCVLFLLVHLLLTVITEQMANSRWSSSPEGKEGMKHLVLNLSSPYVDGGFPVNSALVLAFNSQDYPPTTDSRLSSVFFDFEGRGQAVQTGWIDLGAGLLVMDNGGDLHLVEAQELLSNHHGPQPPTSQKAWDTLATYDANGDEKIDANDPIWPQLKILSKIYRDEQVQRGPLKSLESLGIQAILLDFKEVNESLPNGNYVESVGHFLKTDGSQGQLFEVRFQEQPSQRRFPPLAISADGESVPPVAGMGLVRALPEAATLNPEVKQLVDNFHQAPTRSERWSQLEPLLLAWAKTSQLPPTLAERVAGRYTLVDDGLGAEDSIRASQLYILESFIGRHILTLPDELHPGQDLPKAVKVEGPNLTIVYPQEMLESLNLNYQRLSQKFYNDLILGTYLKPAYELWSQGDIKSLTDYFEEQWAKDPSTTVTSLLEFRIALAAKENFGKKTFAKQAELKELDAYFKRKIMASDINEEQNQLLLDSLGPLDSEENSDPAVLEP